VFVLGKQPLLGLLHKLITYYIDYYHVMYSIVGRKKWDR
jgi:hypothetical protein